ncbi:chromate transporter [Rhizobium sp. BK313]|uniref:chromate transporter n=1 Tax=Rhizobium sp. BK313 TaxID=2587081 RepID=UPI00105C5D14|nr:chromate transporter [Rhizobium sp. BK313]MBB3458785.1 chromate transporter [Rhizobium sp. BK313]
MDKDDSVFILLIKLAPLSLMTIGGGLSIVGDLQRLSVEHGWFTAEGFNEIFALSRVAPGPATLIVTLIGWHVAGFMGAITASLAIFLPSSILTYCVARLWHAHRSAIWTRAVAVGLAPIAAGLIISSTVLLLHDAVGQYIAWLVATLTAALSWRTRSGPLPLLAIGGIVFVALYRPFA